VALNPQSPAAYLSLANAVGEAKNAWGDRDRDWSFSKAIELKPDYAAAYQHRGVGLNKAKKYTEAEAALRRAIKLQPNCVMAYHSLGLTLLAQEKYCEAIEVFRKIQYSPVARYNAACAAALASDGRGDGAKLDTLERTQLRQQALDWLRAAVADVARLNANPARNALTIVQRMQDLQDERDFNGLRDQDALAKLSESERHAWQKLWDDVEALKRQAIPRGFIEDWLVLSELVPYAGTDGNKALDQKMIANESMLRPRAGDPVEANGTTLSWKEHHAQGYIDFQALYGPPAEQRIAYAVCYIHSDADRADLMLRVGSDDQALIYLNGKEVHRSTEARALVLDEDETQPIRLLKGPNVVIFKVVNQDGPGPYGSMHLVTKEGSAPEGIEYRLTP
jgi:tetratricopeptide (TPR) repeat protein